MTDKRLTRAHFSPSANRSLSIAVLEAIDEHKDEDDSMMEFQLYDDIDPDALDALFREDNSAGTQVQFITDGVTVTLSGNGSVEIQVTG